MNIITAMLRCVVGMALFLGFAMPAGADAASPRVVVENFNGALLGTMREASKLGFDGRVQKLAPVVRESFDTATMARLAVGPRWSSLSEQQRSEIVEAFTRFIVATYASRFDGYSDEKFVVKRDTPSGDDAVVVESQMLRPEGEPIAFNYVLRKSDDGWRIGDILFGAVSELANRRAEFSAVIRRDGVDGLISELNKKTKDLEQP